MKRVAVTGGAGFLGSHLCARLLQEKCEVICIDNFYTGRKENIVPLLSNPYFDVLRHDVTFPLYIEVDEIYNLACPVASPLPVRPRADDEDERARRDQHAGAGEAGKSKDSSSLDTGK